ncbi:MAG TPA: hypothetical protein VGF57_07530 [Roseiarcus sp.]|jgi:hypothetical protein
MDTQIEKIYDDLINRKSSDHPGYRELITSIRNAAGSTTPRLRADAVYFLANNIYDLVQEPIYIARAGRLALNQGTTLPIDQDVRTYVDGDLPNIISLSRAVALSRGRDYVSAASAIVGVATVVESLKINEWRLWGP